MTYKLDLDILPLDLHANSSPYVCSFGQDSETDRQTDRLTNDVKTITPITSERWGVIITV